MNNLVDIAGIKDAAKTHPMAFIGITAIVFFTVYHIFFTFLIPMKDNLIDSQRQRIEDLERELADQRNTDRVSSVSVPLQLTTEGIKRQLQVNIENIWYEVHRYYDGELVKGYDGTYYMINIKNAKNKKTIYFEGGKYTIDFFDRQFSKSISKFASDILSQLHGKVRYKIFVKGSADITGDTTFKGYFSPNLKFPVIKMLRKSNHSKGILFENIYQTALIPIPFKNRDLPNLRAAFTQKKLNRDFKELETAVILDGDVVLKHGDHHRNVILLLFTDWKYQ